MAQIKDCENCKYQYRNNEKHPCYVCDENYNMWKSDSIIPPPPDELDKEAQSLIDMFYEKMAFQSTELRRHEIAKQCAIICVDKILKCYNWPSHELAHYTTLKQKIEAL